MKKTLDVKTKREMYRKAVRIKYGGMIDYEIDEFVERGCKGTFDCYKMLMKADLDGVQASEIADLYRGDVKEIENVKFEFPGKGNRKLDEESGYSNFTYTQLDKFLAFVKKIISDCEDWADNKNKVKKHQNLTLPKMFKDFKYKVADDELKVASINPKTLLKANMLVAISCGTKKDLIILKSANSSGFSIDRSTIKNVNYEESCRKTITSGKGLKAVEGVLDDIKQGGKRVVNKLIKNNKWKPVANSDIARINSQVVILKVFK